jgi:hypothetical protein
MSESPTPQVKPTAVKGLKSLLKFGRVLDSVPNLSKGIALFIVAFYLLGWIIPSAENFFSLIPGQYRHFFLILS